MIKYSTIKKLFKDNDLELIQIHTPSKPRKSSKHLTSFIVRKDNETFNVDYELGKKFIDEAVVLDIKNKIDWGNKNQ